MTKTLPGRAMAWLAAAAVAALVTLPAHRGLAQAPPTDFQVEQYEPLASPATNILNAGRSSVLPHLGIAATLSFHYADDEFQLVEKEDNSRIIQRVIDWQFKGELGSAVGLFDFLELGLSMPLVLHQGAGELVTSDPTAPEFATVTLADMRVLPKFLLFNDEGFGLGLLTAIYIPTGDRESYHSEGSLRFEPRLLLDYTTVDGIVFAANIGWQLRKRRVVLNHISDDQLRWSVAVQVPVDVDKRVDMLASVYGAWGLGELDSSNAHATPAEAMLGFNWWPVEELILQAGAGVGLASSVGAPDFRLFATIGYAVHAPTARGPVDTDGDGLMDPADACPLDPEDADGFQDADGCPDPDNDGDGVPDLSDGAPDETGFGRCRNQPEDADGFEDADGCPDPDNDGDGVPDLEDGPTLDNGFGRCLNDPEDADGFQDADGCPDPDNDGDGVLDTVDGAVDETGFGECRDVPENENGFEDEDGCPDELPAATPPRRVEVSADCTRIEIREKVHFKTAKSDILRKSYPLLNEVAEAIRGLPGYDYVSIEGHTDHEGSTGYNQRLSELRAMSVRLFLTLAGIPRETLRAVGHGELKPIATNATASGRAQNRRVEFHVVGAKCE